VEFLEFRPARHKTRLMVRVVRVKEKKTLGCKSRTNSRQLMFYDEDE